MYAIICIMMSRKVLLLCIFILLCGGFIYAKLESMGPPDNFFNTHTRLQIDKYSWLRNVFGFHSYGNARQDYLGPRYGKILIEVDVLDGVTVDTAMLKNFADKVQSITGKPTTYFISDTNLPYSNLTVNDVEHIVHLYRNVFSGDSANLYVLLADTSKDDPKQLGSTYNEYGIVLYESEVKNFTSYSPDTYESYAYSTLLHEFGHQLGLEHDTETGCLMNAKAETNDQPQLFVGEVTTDFCYSEMQQIDAQKLLAQ